MAELQLQDEPIPPLTLPVLAMSNPARARIRAHEVLSGVRDPLDLTYARHALGIVAREAGELTEAKRELRLGLRVAKRHGLHARTAELTATLGTVLAYGGRGRRALELFDEALGLATGPERGKVEVRRGAALYILGNASDAAKAYSRALRLLAGHDEPFWQAIALMNRGQANMALGRLRHVRSDFESARDLQRAAGNDYAAAIALENLGDLAVLEGRLPQALRHLEEATEAYVRSGIEIPEAAEKTSRAYLAAGLPADARAAAERAMALVSMDRVHGPRWASMLITAAAAGFDEGEFAIAEDYAERARRTFARVGHSSGRAAATLLKLQAQVAMDDDAERPQLLRRLRRTAAQMTADGSPLAWEAHLLAGRVAAEAERPTFARAHFSVAARAARSGSALTRAGGWQAEARGALLDDDSRAVLRASSRGLDVLQSHALSLGSTELRARATAHGRDLATLALTEVAAHGDAKDLFHWSERWRAILHMNPLGSSTEDERLVRDLEELRQLTTDPSAPEAARARLEARIRRRSLGQEGSVSRSVAPKIDELFDELGSGTSLMSVVGIDGTFHVVVARAGRLRRFIAGSASEAREEVERALFALRTTARLGPAMAATLTSSLRTSLERLQRSLLGPALDCLGDEAVVLVPPARLQSAPWGALPGLHDRAVSVAPSAAAWLRARRTLEPTSGHVTVVGGPELGSRAAEVSALAAMHPGAIVLRGHEAGCDAVLGALDGARLAHIGAHGTFRGDNPMFSAIELSDGPLTVYDTERLRHAPYRLVLSACESGVGAPTGADELLGLSNSLAALGTAGLMASVLAVNDEAAVGFSIAVHRSLQRGADFAEALLDARQSEPRDAMAVATAYSFLALGAA